MQINKWLAAGMLATAVASSGCATIIHGGGDQNVTFTSSPVGATVTVDNRVIGTTPTQAELKRKIDHYVTLDLPGYAPQSETLQSKLSGWAFGNILLGGIIGVIVDASTGGMYRLTPEVVHGNFGPAGAAKTPVSAQQTYPAVSAPQFTKGTQLTLPAGTRLQERPTPNAPGFQTTQPEVVTLIGDNAGADPLWFVKNAKISGWLRAAELPRP